MYYLHLVINECQKCLLSFMMMESLFESSKGPSKLYLGCKSYYLKMK